MPPLPTADLSTGDISSTSPKQSASEIDLTKIRQGWNKQFENLDSMPLGSEISVTETQSQAIEALPELPSLGAMASQAAMSMDDLDHYLSRYHQPDSVNSESVDLVSSSEQYASVPQMPTKGAADDVSTSSQIKVEKLSDLPAFPVPSAPEVSFPLARDTFLEQPEDSPAEPVTSRPNFDDLRKTAPQYSKFSPETTEDKTEEKTEESLEADTINSELPDFTDEDLRVAIQPIINPVVDQFLYTPSQGIHTYLEPMLRSTVRRAIAEQMRDASPFNEVSGWDKFGWKLRAMFSSRTYDDIVFDYTRRYQVEEVYLLRPHSRSLISYASQDPARHSKPEKVESTVRKIASKESEHKDDDKPWIKWRDTRNLMIRRGEHCILAAIVHGPSNAILRADLDYALRQAEERFGKALEEESDIHMQILQPLLEGCLLIQAPAIPN